MSSHTVVRFNWHSRDLAQSTFCLGWHVLTFSTLVLLPEGAYLGTCKHYEVGSRQRERAVHSL